MLSRLILCFRIHVFCLKHFTMYLTLLFVRRQSEQMQTTADSTYSKCCAASNTYAFKMDLCQSFLARRPVCTSENFVASGAGSYPRGYIVKT